MLWNGETVIVNKRSLGAFVFNTLSSKRFKCLVPNETGVVGFELFHQTTKIKYGTGWVKQINKGFCGNLDVMGIHKKTLNLTAKNKKTLKKVLQNFYKECNKASLGL